MTQKNIKRLIFAIAWCILIGGCLWTCIGPVSSKPWRIGSVQVPAMGVATTLYFGSMREVGCQPYDGVYRMLEVAQTGAATVFYDLPELINTDDCRIEVYAYPSDNLLRFKDTGLSNFARDFRSECLLDITQKTMFTVIRGNGVTHIAKLSEAMTCLTNPLVHDKDRVAHSYGGDPAELSPTSSATVIIGNETTVVSHAMWTTNAGIFVGVLAPKKSQ
jgi:hypothetical protein